MKRPPPRVPHPLDVALEGSTAWPSAQSNEPPRSPNRRCEPASEDILLPEVAAAATNHAGNDEMSAAKHDSNRGAQPKTIPPATAVAAINCAGREDTRVAEREGDKGTQTMTVAAAARCAGSDRETPSMAVGKPQDDVYSTPKSVIEATALRDRRVHDPPPSEPKKQASPAAHLSPLAKEQRPMLLMEALAASDTASMSASLPLAGEREVHAAMLNACAKGDAAAVSVLLGKADDAAISQGLVVCARSGHAEIVEQLLPRCDRDVLQSALLQSATRNHIAMLELMLSRGCPDADVIRRALLSCAAKGHAEALRIILPHVQEGRPETLSLALLTSCSRGQAATAAQLLQVLEDVSLAQPLAICAAKNHVELAALLAHTVSTRKVEADLAACHHAYQIALRRNAGAVAERLREVIGPGAVGTQRHTASSCSKDKPRP